MNELGIDNANLPSVKPLGNSKAEKENKPIAKGLPAGPGGAFGMVVFTANDAVKWAKDGQKVILVREDLKLPKGKLAVQSSHASVDAMLKSDKNSVDIWRREGAKKVVLKVKDEKELLKYKKLAEDYGLKTAVITDAGRTVLEPGTITCLGIGPDLEEKIDKVSGKLKML